MSKFLGLVNWETLRESNPGLDAFMGNPLKMAGFEKLLAVGRVNQKRAEVEAQVKKVNGIVAQLKNAGLPSETFNSVMVGLGAISAGATVVFPPVGIFLGLMTTLTSILEKRDIFGTKRKRIEGLKNELEKETQILKGLYSELFELTEDVKEKQALQVALQENAPLNGFLGIQDNKVWLVLAGLLFLFLNRSKRKKRR